MSEKTFHVPLRSTVEGMQWLYNTATDNFIRGLRDANAELAALRAEVERLKKELAAEKRRVIAAWEPYLCGGCIKRLHQGEAAMLAAITGSLTAPAEEEGRDE